MKTMTDEHWKDVDKSACATCSKMYHIPFSEISNKVCRECGQSEWIRVVKVKVDGTVYRTGGDVWFLAATPTYTMEVTT